MDVAALLGRYTLEQLCELAAEKDAGFDRRVFADALAAAAAHSDAAFAELGLGRQLWPPYGRVRLDGAPNCWMPQTCRPPDGVQSVGRRTPPVSEALGSTSAPRPPERHRPPPSDASRDGPSLSR